MKNADTRDMGRIATSVLSVWLFFAAAQAALVMGLGNSSLPPRLIIANFGLHALVWTAITIALRRIHPRIRLRGGPLGSLLGHLALLLCASVLDALTRRAISAALIAPPAVSFARTMLFYADMTTLSYFLAVWIGRVIDAREALLAQTRHELALRAQLARARLEYLHAQLQPHFLFNALGTVSELIFENPVAAIRTFRQLLAVLRSAASRDSSEIPLKEEIAILTPYLEVQRTRFSDWLEIDLHIAADAAELLVPPLLLQPLVENSIRHGLQGRSSRGRITVRADVQGDRLILSVRDNGAGLKVSNGIRRMGVGLSNTEERLRTLYGSEATLSLYNDDAGGAVASVVMPARRALPGSKLEKTSPLETLPVRTGFADRRPVATLLTGGALASLLWTQQSYAYLALAGRLGEKTPVDIARDDFVMVAMWTAMVPAVIWIARRLPLGGGTKSYAAVLHTLAFVSLGAAHSILATMYRNAGDPTDWISTLRGSMPLTLLVYLAALAYSQRKVFQEWLAERQVAAMRINTEITEARIAAASVSVAPESLDFTLRELERYAATDPLEAERVIAQLGVELRATLETVSMDRSPDEPSGGGAAAGREGRVERLAMGA